MTFLINVYLVIMVLFLQGCLESFQDFKTTEIFPSHKLPPHVLWQTVQGSASLRGLPPSTILHGARRIQNLFATGHIGQQAFWEEEDVKAHMVIFDISRDSSVPCLKYRQTLQTPKEVRHSEGKACMDAFQVWRIVEEIPADPIRRLL